MFVLNLILLGERSALNLTDALKKADLNLTQALILWYLAENKVHENGYSSGMTLTSLSLGLYMHKTRLQPQIAALRKIGFLKDALFPSIEDKRHKHYVLTEAGIQKTTSFIAYAKLSNSKAISSVSALIPRRAKDQEKWRAIQKMFVEAHLKPDLA